MAGDHKHFHCVYYILIERCLEKPLPASRQLCIRFYICSYTALITVVFVITHLLCVCSLILSPGREACAMQYLVLEESFVVVVVLGGMEEVGFLFKNIYVAI